ncbi:MAG TPA: hypothetical protein VF587_08105 [Solirubrobacteraceae bacterium]|jgi:hypothetical protein
MSTGPGLALTACLLVLLAVVELRRAGGAPARTRTLTVAVAAVGLAFVVGVATRFAELL